MKTCSSTIRNFGLFLALAGLVMVFLGLNIPVVSAISDGDEALTPTPEPGVANPTPAASLTPATTESSNPTNASPHSRDNCLACHSKPNLQGKLQNGEIVSLTIVPAVHNETFHAKEGIGCQICHDDQRVYPHIGSTNQACTICHWQISGTAPQTDQMVFDLPFEDSRSLALSINKVCQQCHANKETEVKDSAHTRLLIKEGNRYAPVCVDCHSGHNIITVDRLTISNICSKCHNAQYLAYKGSVHGAALEKDSNPDVPTCGDCHGTHQVIGASDSKFRESAASDMCGKCHANKPLMDKYGLSSEVLSTYMDDVHGQTDLMGNLDNTNITKATCYDCHGTHNILSPLNPYSKVYPDNLQGTCQRCHKDANITFPQAWLSHKTPSLSIMPGLYLTNILSLAGLIVFAVVCVLYIILDIRRRRLSGTTAIPSPQISSTQTGNTHDA